MAGGPGTRRCLSSLTAKHSEVSPHLFLLILCKRSCVGCNKTTIYNTPAHPVGYVRGSDRHQSSHPLYRFYRGSELGASVTGPWSQGHRVWARRQGCFLNITPTRLPTSGNKTLKTVPRRALLTGSNSNRRPRVRTDDGGQLPGTCRDGDNHPTCTTRDRGWQGRREETLPVPVTSHQMPPTCLLPTTLRVRKHHVPDDNLASRLRARLPGDQKLGPRRGLQWGGGAS